MYKEDIDIQNVYVFNNSALKYMKQILKTDNRNRQGHNYNGRLYVSLSVIKQEGRK